MKKKNIIYIITFGGCGRGRVCKILVYHDFIEKKIIMKVCEEMGLEFILKVKRIMEAIFHLSLFLVKEAFNCLKNEAGFTQCIKFRSNAYCGKLNLIYAIYVNIFI